MARWKTMKTTLENFFFENMSHRFKCSFYDKSFSSIGLTIVEIQNGKKKRGYLKFFYNMRTAGSYSSIIVS